MRFKKTEAELQRERIAEYAHLAWCNWMKYLFTKCDEMSDGEMVIPRWAVDRWTRQMNTPYVALPEDEKDSDRKEADRILDIVGRHR